MIRLTTLVHATLHISDVTDKLNWWLVDVTFDERPVMSTAVERNNQTRRFITFLRRLFYKIYTETSQIMNKNDVKPKYKYKNELHFPVVHPDVWTHGVLCIVTYFARDPLRSYFDEKQENELYYLNKGIGYLDGYCTVTNEAWTQWFLLLIHSILTQFYRYTKSLILLCV